MTVFHHYTNATGYRGILTSMVLRPSLKANNPKDARYGDGQYFSDIAPGSMTARQLSIFFIRSPFGAQRFTYYLSVDLAGLNVEHGREHVYVVKNDNDMSIANRLTKHGVN
jgi:HYD1 signature containing ADP-ribosyltransferase